MVRVPSWPVSRDPPKTPCRAPCVVPAFGSVAAHEHQGLRPALRRAESVEGRGWPKTSPTQGAYLNQTHFPSGGWPKTSAGERFFLFPKRCSSPTQGVNQRGPETSFSLLRIFSVRNRRGTIPGCKLLEVWLSLIREDVWFLDMYPRRIG